MITSNSLRSHGTARRHCVSQPPPYEEMNFVQFLDLACGPPPIPSRLRLDGAFLPGLRLGAALPTEVVGRSMPDFDDALRMTLGVSLRAEEPWLMIRVPLTAF